MQRRLFARSSEAVQLALSLVVRPLAPACEEHAGAESPVRDHGFNGIGQRVSRCTESQYLSTLRSEPDLVAGTTILAERLSHHCEDLLGRPTPNGCLVAAEVLGDDRLRFGQ